VIPPDDPTPAEATWVQRPECGFPPLAGGLRMRFHVVDVSGAVVGAEDIPYTVEEDGFYVLDNVVVGVRTRH
jgi:hypothetical protein